MIDHYINTYSGTTLFSAPKGIEDYRAWLIDQYNHCQKLRGETSVYFGVAQKINALMLAAGRGERIYAIGPHAIEAQMALEEISKGVILIELADADKK